MRPSQLCMGTRSIIHNRSHRRRILLLTFDAFETLFYPHPPVPNQYAAIGHDYGLSRTAVTPTTLTAAFKDAYRAQAKKYPNYGRADVLKGQYGGPKQWWEEVIRASFDQVLALEKSDRWSRATSQNHRDGDLPTGMVETLLNRFAGDGGYTLYKDVLPFFARMRELRASSPSTAPYDRILLGVISNSDDRVPAVLEALGLRVGNTRADEDRSSLELPGFEKRTSKPKSNAREPIATNQKVDVDADIDVVITSYEAGEEKPSRSIFDVAKRQARLLVKDDAHTSDSARTALEEADDWTCIHIGDDYYKDYVGAIDAGWQSYLLERDGAGGGEVRAASSIRSLMDLFSVLTMST